VPQLPNEGDMRGQKLFPLCPFKLPLPDLPKILSVATLNATYKCPKFGAHSAREKCGLSECQDMASRNSSSTE